MWLATGGRSGVNDRVDILKNRKILVFADWLIRWKQAPDTMTLPADTPIQQARLELVLNELRHYWSEETVQAAAPLIEDLDLEIKSVTYIKPNEDIPLKECVRRANKLSCQIGHPIQETIIISIQVNAAFPSHTDSDGIVFYLSDAGRKAIIGLHVEGIVNYLAGKK